MEHDRDDLEESSRPWYRSPIAWAGAIAVLVLAAGLPLVVREVFPPGPPLGQVWMAQPGTIGRINRLAPDVADRFFDRGGSYALGGGWKGATPAIAWASVVDFVADLQAERVPEHVRTVMYDPEHWKATPESEQRDPVAAMELFSRAARLGGYRVVITPHPNLVEVPDAVCTVRRFESVESAYLRCGIQGEAARLSDVVEIQAQYLEGSPDQYRRFVSAAATQCREANPDVVVLSGLSTRFAPQPGVLRDAWEAVQDVVDGHYLAMPLGINPWVATAFLLQITNRR
jgi:hypothetical protein